MISTLTPQSIQDFSRDLLHRVFLLGASDLHLELYQGVFNIRYRLGNELLDYEGAPTHLGGSVIRYIKTLAHLNPRLLNRPQDGKMLLLHNHANIEMRLSSLPTEHGESLVIRYLSTLLKAFSLNTLGLSPCDLDKVTSQLGQTSGLCLFTGPTGSGKTTSLYAALEYLQSSKKKILTAEDPVERFINNTTQIQVNANHGLSFPNVIKAFLRQDPDILMIGEIRDRETAVIAIEAALTGHLVLTSLHTADTGSSIDRLLNLGIPAYQLAATLKTIVSQRMISLSDGSSRPSFETMIIDKDIRQMIADGHRSNLIRQAAAEKGMSLLPLKPTTE